MRRRFTSAFCGVFIALSYGPLAAQSPAAPQVGQIVDTEPFYNSEKIWGTGLCDDASTACTYLFYENGPEVVILLGATAKTNADGGVIAIRVTEAARLPIKRGFKSVGECDLDGRALLISYVNRAETEIIGFYVEDKKIRLVEGRRPQKINCSTP